MAARPKALSAQQAVEGARYTRRLMEEAFPDALVERGAYERLIDGMPNNETDRHVLAAAPCPDRTFS